VAAKLVPQIAAHGRDFRGGAGAVVYIFLWRTTIGYRIAPWS
jgi:hypothetical protein